MTRLLELVRSDGFGAAFDAFERRYMVWGAWGLAAIEIAAVALRALGAKLHLVSYEARGLAFGGLTALAYFAGSMSIHWFVTWRRVPWSDPVAHVLGVFFWAVFLAYVIASYADPNPRYWPIVTQWLRYPPVACAIGGVLAFFCFPQESVWAPGRPW